MDRLGHRLTVRRASRGDEGFTLVEVTISLVLLAIVLTSALSLFVRALGNTDVQAQRQQAISIATKQLEKVRALPVGDIVDGRTAASVATLWTDWPSNAQALGVQAYDSTATSSSSPTIKTADTLDKTKYDNVTFTMRTYIDTCYLSATTTDCGKTASSTTRAMYRITVSVAWSPRITRPCDATTKKSDSRWPGNTCQEYVVSTLRDPSDDATFNTN